MVWPARRYLKLALHITYKLEFDPFDAWNVAQVLGHQPKIIATVRSVPDCAASFVRIAKPEDLDDFLF